MEKKLSAIRVHLKNGAFRKFSVNGNITFQQRGEFLHIENDKKTLVTVATPELSYIEYFYSEAKSQ